VTPRLLKAQNRSNPVTSTTRSSPATETAAMSGSYRSFLWTRSAPALTTQASAATHRHRDTVATEHAHPADSTNVRTCRIGCVRSDVAWRPGGRGPDRQAPRPVTSSSSHRTGPEAYYPWARSIDNITLSDEETSGRTLAGPPLWSPPVAHASFWEPSPVPDRVVVGRGEDVASGFVREASSAATMLG
jgi:hypothetical protein